MPNQKDPITARSGDRLLPNSMNPDFIPEPAHDRAQPGDVLGVESDGETTHLGETREDEDERREAAEKAVNDGRTSRPR